MPSDNQDSLPSQIQALVRSIGEASTSYHGACKCALQNATSALAELQKHSSTFSPRSQPFAAIIPNFARASNPKDGSKRKGKGNFKSKVAVEESFSENSASSARKQQEKQLSASSAPQQAAPPSAQKEPERKNEQADDTPEILRELDKVREKPPKTDGELRALMLAALKSRMTKEQQAKVDARVWKKLMKRIRATVDNENGVREYNLRQLMSRAQRGKAFKEMGGDEPAIRKKLRGEVMDSIPSWHLVTDTPKMQLRPQEHEALPLDRLGEGHLFSPHRWFGHKLGGLHDFSWGMFARIDRARRVLSKWAHEDPEQVLRLQEFYNDIMSNAAKLELTLMMVAERPIPILQLRDKFLERQSIVMRQIPENVQYVKDELDPEQKLLLARIKRKCTVEAFKDSGLIDRKGNILPDTKLFFTVGPQWQLTAEAITPGILAEQQTVLLGFWKDKAFTRSVMENFLGLYTVDPIGKTSVGNGALYVANGFNFEPPEYSGNPMQVYQVEEGEEDQVPFVQVPAITAGSDNFQIDIEPCRPLLNGISRMR